MYEQLDKLLHELTVGDSGERKKWLSTPNKDLHGLAPNHFIQLGKPEIVYHVLLKMQHGEILGA